MFYLFLGKVNIEFLIKSSKEKDEDVEN